MCAQRSLVAIAIVAITVSFLGVAVSAQAPGSDALAAKVRNAANAAAVARVPARTSPLDPALARRVAAEPACAFAVDLWLRFDPSLLEAAADRVDPLQDRAADDASRAARAAAVAAFNQTTMAPALEMLEILRLPVLHADVYAPLICTVADAASLDALDHSPLVARILPAHAALPASDSAVATHRWDRVYDFGVRGDGIKLAIVEGGLISTAGTSLLVNNTHIGAQPVSAHATAVAAVAGSYDMNLPGYARGVWLLNANPADGSLGSFAAACGWAVGDGASVLNASVNIDDGSLVLTAWDYYVDYLVRYLRVTFTVSAANAGLASGAVKSPGLAWNVITVGAFEDQNDGIWLNDAMAPYSSFNDPISAMGDREKPELVAVGTNITVVGSSGASESWSGTSVAAPALAGMAAGLMQADRRLAVQPEGTKAILMAAATHNIEGNSGLSEKDGAGGINGLQALRVVEQGHFETGIFTTGSFDAFGNNARTVQLLGGDRTRVALAWSSDADAGYATDTLKADLDLFVYQGAGTTGPLVASSSSYDNSYEIVDFCPPVSGPYTILVNRYRFDGVLEPYGLAWTQDQDGRHARFRPSYPTAPTDDRSGPVIGNPTFHLDPYEPQSAGLPYICVASGGFTSGTLLYPCRLLPLDLDAISDLSITPGSPYFLSFIGVLDAFGEAPNVRIAIPDLPSLAGASIRFGMVSIDGSVQGAVREIARVEELTFWDHAVDLPLADDGSVAVNLGFTLPFFGNNYAVAYVNANGNLTFTGGDPTYVESIPGFLGGGPRIAPLWDDLDPAAGGKVRARFAGSRFVVEWVEVPKHGDVYPNTFMVVLHQSGKIELKYRSGVISDGLTGISPGLAGTAPFEIFLANGSRYPDPVNHPSAPAIFQLFNTITDPFNLWTFSDKRTTLTFTPDPLFPARYHFTYDRDE